jgi:hypothetical protein
VSAAGRRVHLEDYGQEVYALPAAAADLGDRIGRAYRLASGGPYRWRTDIGEKYWDSRLHETKAQAKRDLRDRAQAVLDKRCQTAGCTGEAVCPDGLCAACSLATVTLDEPSAGTS